MQERRVFSFADLRRILTRVLCRHADDDVSVFIDFRAVQRLTEDLRVFAVVDVADNPEALPSLMASLATMVYGQKVFDYQGEDAGLIDALMRKICSEFAIECVAFFARTCGYRVSLELQTRSQIMLAFLTPDWPRLADIFQESTSLSVIGEGRSDLLYEDPDDVRYPMQLFERQFARQLSAESYANLRSERAFQGWSSDDLILLIDEYMSPELRPDLVHHSNAVSGEDWRNLHDWISRQNGRPL